VGRERSEPNSNSRTKLTRAQLRSKLAARAAALGYAPGTAGYHRYVLGTLSRATKNAAGKCTHTLRRD
jgi:hypothetical protein